MYSLFKLSPQTRSQIQDYLSSATNREAIFAVAVGYASASTLALPPQQVDDLRDYFANNAKRGVEALLSCFNEMAPFDTVSAREHAWAFYKLRYNMVFVKASPIAMKPETAIVDFFGISNALPNATLELITQHPAKLSVLVGRLREVLREIGTQQAADELRRQATREEEGNYVAS